MASESTCSTPTPTNNTNFLPQSPCILAGGEPCNACREAFTLEDDIFEAEKHLAHLKARRLPLRGKINAYHDPLTRRLPPELISNIFLHAVTESPYIEHRKMMADNPNNYQKSQQIPSVYNPNLPDDWETYEPLQLGWICRSWRRIAWSTPQIWTGIDLDMTEEDLCEQHVELLQACLDRSAALPLHLWVLGDDDPNSNIFPMRMLDLLRHHSSRWVNLEIFLPLTLLQHLFYSLEAHPMLNALTLQSDSEDLWSHPSIRRLKHININLNYLTQATLNFPQVADCLELLFHAPQLLQFTTKYIRFDEDPLPSVPCPLTHHHLRYLTLLFSDKDAAAAFLPRVAFTVLEELELAIDDEMGTSIINHTLGPEFTKSLATVKKMQFGCDLCGHAFLTVLEHSPALEYISFSFTNKITDGSLDPFLQLLSLDVSNGAMKHPNFLPILQEIQICNPPTLSFDLIPHIFRHTPTPPIESGLSRPLQSLHISEHGLLHRQHEPFYLYSDGTLFHHLLIISHETMVGPSMTSDSLITFHCLPISEDTVIHRSMRQPNLKCLGKF